MDSSRQIRTTILQHLAVNIRSSNNTADNVGGGNCTAHVWCLNVLATHVRNLAIHVLEAWAVQWRHIWGKQIA